MSPACSLRASWGQVFCCSFFRDRRVRTDRHEDTNVHSNKPVTVVLNIYFGVVVASSHQF